MLLLFHELFAATEAFSLNLVCIAVTAFALLPAYLWIKRKALGMPIFPMFSITFIWTYALPIISNNSNIIKYSVDQRLFAGLTTLSFLAVGCAIWFQLVRKVPSPRLNYLSLRGSKGNATFFIALAVSVLFNVAIVGGWLNVFTLSGGVFAIFRHTTIAFTSLSSFVLSYKLGKEELTLKEVRLLVFLLTSFSLVTTLSFLLIGAATVFLSSVAAFVIGRRKVPMALLVVVALCFSFLHAGKTDMRNRYWGNSQQSSYIQPWQYPTVYAEWIDNSIRETTRSGNEDRSISEGSQTFSDRASVIQMLLLSQSLSPRTVPFLQGYTYEFLPEMLVPRLLHPQKPWSHEGTIRLNVYYGRQTRAQTLRINYRLGFTS